MAEGKLCLRLGLALLATLALATGACTGPTEQTAKAYIAGATGDEIAILNLSTWEVVTVKGVENPHGGNVTVDGRRMFVGSTKEPVITILDTEKGAFVDRIEVSGAKSVGHFQTHPNGRYMYANSGRDILVIDVVERKVVARAESGERPYHLFPDPAGERLYVNNRAGEDTLSVFAVKAEGQELVLLGKVAVGKDPEHVTVSPDGRFVYTGNGQGDSLSVVEAMAMKEVARIAVGKGPHGLGVTLDGKKILTANAGEGSISVVSTQDHRLVATKQMLSGPQHMHAHISPWDGTFWVTGSEGHKLLIIDPETLEVLKDLPLQNGHQIGFYPKPWR